jgi:hypothetical protein
VEAVSLIVSWFGSDLRCGNCTIRPKVEQSLEDAVGMNWSVSGLVRASAATVPLLSGSPVYGGTPTDASVVEGILALKNSGKAVMFYPFILMDQMEGNTLPDPWSGAVGQPALPWRGRITASLAPGMDGSPDTTAAAAIEVATFFGLAQASDFVISGSTVSYTGAQDWGYRRFILHCAHLCVAAGGVDAFCIGSEMRGLTQIRGAAHSFPAVDALRMLAADVRAILGPLTKITYAADWSEYFGCHTGDNVYFHLDSLWAHPAIDCIGIDNYMPLADWRDGEFHADAAFGSIYNLDYLMANVAGGEGFDWYYDGPEGEAAQLRKSIVDGAYGEPWVFRYKDLKSWWQNQHFQRINGVRSATPTDWVQQSKPFWFTEFGCAAIDKGANQPNLFLDPKSSESCLPRGSNGQRDDLMQAQYLRAISEFWADPANNPTSTSYAGKMLDTSRLFAWAWDARPYPAFPALSDKWSDGNNYLRGHWLNGRSSNQLLAGVVAEICVESGVVDLDLSQINGIVRGYSIAQIGTARSALQPLTLAHALDGFERDGLLKFAARTSFGAELIDSDEVAIAPSLDGSIVFNRQSEAEIIGRLRLGFVQADGDFAVRTIEATLPNDGSEVTSTSELPLMLTSAEAVTIAERWLSESQAARDSLRLALPPSMQPIGVGDVVSVQDKTYRIDSVETSEIQLLGATRIHGALYASGSEISDPATYAVISAPTPVYPVFMDLPLLTGDERPHAAHVCIVAKPWLGPAAIWSSSSDAGYSRVALADRSATFGLTLTALAAETTGLWARGPGLRVKLSSGALSSASSAEVLAGANTAFIGDSTDDNWEVFQFQTAELVAPQTYDLRLRLRGQAGTNGIMPALWPQGSRFVLFNSALQQLDLAGSTRGISRHYRAGLAAPGYSDTRVVHQEHVFSGIGYRPYSVAHLAVQGQLGSTIDVGWIRRTRIDGDPWSAIDVPLGEEQERYLVRVLQASAILRETAVSAAGWSYSSSQQSADGAGPAAVIEVAQISSRFGPGPFVSVAI